MARAASMLGENDRRVRTRCRCGVHALFCPRMQSGTWVCRSVNACGRVRCTGARGLPRRSGVGPMQKRCSIAGLGSKICSYSQDEKRGAVIEQCIVPL